MNKQLRFEFFKLFDKGITDFNKLDTADEYKLRAVFFSSLSRTNQEEYLSEAVMCSSGLIFDEICETFKYTSIQNCINLAFSLIGILGKRLSDTLADLFIDALEEYNMNNLLNDQTPQHRITDRDLDVLVDNRDRL